MHLIFFAQSKAHYRYYSPLIYYSLKENFKVTVFENKLSNLKVKFNSYIKKKYINFKYFENDKELNNLIDKIEFDFFLSLNPFFEKINKTNLKKLSGKFCILMHGDDNFLTVDDWQGYNPKSKLHLDYKRNFFIHNLSTYNFYLNLIQKYSKNKEKKNFLYFTDKNTKKIEIGDLQICNELLNLNKDKIRDEFSIPNDKKIILYLPFPFVPSRNKNFSQSFQIVFSGIYHAIHQFKKNSGLIKFIYLIKTIYFYIKIFTSFSAINIFFNKKTEKKIMQELRKFCDRNNYFLITKPKNKYTVPSFLFDYAHKVIIDQQNEYFPSIFQKLLSLSDYTVSYYSTSIRESARYNVFNINIKLPNIYFDNNPIHFMRYETNGQSNYEFKGVIETVNVDNFIKILTENDLENKFKLLNFRRQKYISKFLSINNNDAVVNFINYIKKFNKNK